MRLICYPTSTESLKIVTACPEREWMGRTDQSFAYRCLPLNIANAYGWLILNTIPFTAMWSGEAGLEAVSVRPASSTGAPLASSHFGSGVLTFHVNGLFRTEPRYDLMVTGPLNSPKDSIQPLSGVVETDWSPFTFTMNWKFTRKLTAIAFERDEPFCMIFPLKRGLLEEVQPEFCSMDANEEIRDAYRAFSENRRRFNESLKVAGSEAQVRKWQKEYFRGITPFGKVAPDHRTKIKLKDFVSR